MRHPLYLNQKERIPVRGLKLSHRVQRVLLPAPLNHVRKERIPVRGLKLTLAIVNLDSTCYRATGQKRTNPREGMGSGLRHHILVREEPFLSWAPVFGSRNKTVGYQG